MDDLGVKWYQVLVKGRLDAAWSDWFDRFEIAYSGGQTVLTGPVVDQAALLGLLMKLHDLGLTVLAFRTIASLPGKDFDAAG